MGLPALDLGLCLQLHTSYNFIFGGDLTGPIDRTTSLARLELVPMLRYSGEQLKQRLASHPCGLHETSAT
jgi:hypothetical protein